LKAYQSQLWDSISKFSAFNIDLVSRTTNKEVNFLVNVLFRLIPNKISELYSFSDEFLFKPSIPDNITNWHVFNDDKRK